MRSNLVGKHEIDQETIHYSFIARGHKVSDPWLDLLARKKIQKLKKELHKGIPNPLFSQKIFMNGLHYWLTEICCFVIDIACQYHAMDEFQTAAVVERLSDALSTLE